MVSLRFLWACFTPLIVGVFVSSCGIGVYPGQPGMVTNGEAKIDLEVLDEEGLWIYQVEYDNRLNGAGVNSITTKLFPGALTYTTNVRTNMEGTLYRHKYVANGALLQMISFPQRSEIILPEDSRVVLIAELDISSDEIDDRNVAEANIFKRELTSIRKGLNMLRTKWEFLKLGEFTPQGRLSYSIKSVILGDKVFEPNDPVILETNLIQTGVFIDLTKNLKQQFVSFLDDTYPEGFTGIAKIVLRDGKIVEIPTSLKTRKSLELSGSYQVKIVSREDLNKQLVK